MSTVPQRSPLRYPGGKTWLIPHIRAWLSRQQPVPVIVEPFAGGASVSLTAVMEGYADRAVLVDLDRDVSAFWRAALRHTDEMIDRVVAFEPTRANVEALETAPATLIEHGFRTLVLNRTRRSGVLAPGASLLRNGENGAGLASRWYPDTLARRLRAIGDCADRISFFEGDGVSLIEILAPSGAWFFVDPPYSAATGKQAGTRLYAHHQVDHRRLFETLAQADCGFLMTYDCNPQTVGLAARHRFCAVTVPMRTAHHNTQIELLITRAPTFTQPVSALQAVSGDA